MDPKLLQSLEWRLVGPFRGGRVPAVVGHPSEPATFFFGACAGGVWKTTDGGQYWENVSDGYFKTSAVGALAIAESDPNVIYAGMGETQIRGNVSHGDGVYKSTDGGASWSHCGLADTHAIGAIRVHPTNPDLVYVAALGHVWGPNDARGVYRSRDGGRTWDKVLYRSENAGAIDLTMDPSNPRLLYAAMWDARRGPYYLRSGGSDSSIYASTDGGDTWIELTRNPGLPKGVLGKIGVAAAPRTGRVWALVEAEDGALFRSDDGGATWERLSELADLRRRAWYYTHIFADPRDADTVYVLNLKMWKSVDGGKTFSAIPTPHGDNQDLWIDPRDPRRMIEGNDGGACVTYNGGLSWSSIYNQPTAQFYHVTTDQRTPYRLYGSQQDNTALSVPSASARGAICYTEVFEPGGGESGYIAVKPADENVIFGGAIGSGAGNGRLIRYDHRTMETRIVTVWPEVQGMGRGAKDLRYRFQWTFPISFSPHAQDTLYVTSNVVHRSTDDGMSWEVISPDLTKAKAETLEPSGGSITNDNTGAEAYATIFAFGESPHEAGVFWAGSDDGLIHISRDDGKTWDNVTPDEFQDWTQVLIIEPSPHDPATAYVAASRYKVDDFAPYLFKTSDYGQTWTRIDGGIPRGDFTRVICEDPERAGLLFVGTETGLYVSFDDGVGWQRFGDGAGSLPVCPIYDLEIKGTDLIVATHGRAFWILDDISPLRQLVDGPHNGPAHLFAPRPARRFKVYGRFGDPALPAKSYGRAGGMVVTNYQRARPNGEVDTTFLDAGKNPPDGAIVYYYLQDTPKGRVTLTFKNAAGDVVRTFSSAKPEPAVADAGAAGGEGLEGQDTQTEAGATADKESLKVTTAPGLNRFVWNLRYPNATGIEGLDPASSPLTLTPDMLLGPVAVPGTYSVELAVDGQTFGQEFEIQADPRVSGSQDDLQAQFDLLLKIRDTLSETHAAVNRVRGAQEQLKLWAKSENEAVKTAAQALATKLAAVEETLVQPKGNSPRMFPSGLNEKLAALPGMISNADTRPATQYYEVYDKLAGEIDAALAQVATALDTDVQAFNETVQRAGVAAIVA